MGNGYNHHLQHQSLYKKNSYLPFLCQVSIKDDKFRDCKDRSASASISNDPSSPKVSCVGQVKKNNRLIRSSTQYRLTAIPATCATTTTSTDAITSKSNKTYGLVMYTKIKRLFSGKNLLTSSLATTNSTANNAVYGGGNTRSCREMITRRNGSRWSSKINNDNGVDVNISELDPPLPVIKKVHQPCEVNLWKRRYGGPALKSLQIE
ncbi:hypothetical protein ACH5RR_026299 [Cinchona calisaya]|uniref:Uncharacterized protein n=1 Tax=Cinchona calisaya TaxID=153742 RepID=A0ABD2Z255_9GENT